MYVPIIALFVNFFTSGLIINLFQLAIWLSIRPLSLQLYRKLNYYALYLLWSRKYISRHMNHYINEAPFINR